MPKSDENSRFEQKGRRGCGLNAECRSRRTIQGIWRCRAHSPPPHTCRAASFRRLRNSQLANRFRSREPCCGMQPATSHQGSQTQAGYVDSASECPSWKSSLYLGMLGLVLRGVKSSRRRGLPGLTRSPQWPSKTLTETPVGLIAARHDQRRDHFVRPSPPPHLSGLGGRSRLRSSSLPLDPIRGILSPVSAI